jgi:hypothetical protein
MCGTPLGRADDPEVQMVIATPSGDVWPSTATRNSPSCGQPSGADNQSGCPWLRTDTVSWTQARRSPMLTTQRRRGHPLAQGSKASHHLRAPLRTTCAVPAQRPADPEGGFGTLRASSPEGNPLDRESSRQLFEKVDPEVHPSRNEARHVALPQHTSQLQSTIEGRQGYGDSSDTYDGGPCHQPIG